MKVEIDQKTASTISEIAAINGTSPERIVARALEKDARYWREYEEDKANLQAMKEGDFISQDDMFKKLDHLAKEATTLAEKLN